MESILANLHNPEPAESASYKDIFAFFAKARDAGLLAKAYERLHAL